VLATLDHMDEIGVIDRRLAVVGRALQEAQTLSGGG
jgi:hypothetical protein